MSLATKSGLMKKINLIELNEINFDIVKEYISENSGQFPGFEKLLDLESYETFLKMFITKLNLGYNGPPSIRVKHMTNIAFLD